MTNLWSFPRMVKSVNRNLSAKWNYTKYFTR